MWDKNIIGQERVKDILKNIFRNGKISHSYIFYGIEGAGKDAVAIEFAKLLNCDSPLNGNEACDICKSCIETDSFRFPLFKFITALPTGKSESDEDTNPLEKLENEDFEIYREELDFKVKDKYHKITIPRANEIRISSIRQIKKEIYFTGKSGKKKIFLISEADRMNQQSANSLLKILEEPPGDSVIILTTSRLNSLLPTITGRCQKIRFDIIGKSNIKKYIKKNFGNKTDAEAEFLAELSGGSITKCNDILEKNFIELREKVLDMLSSLLTNQYLKLSNDIDFIAGKKNKERVKQFLALLVIWFRDILNKSGGSDELIINKDKSDRISKFVANFDSRNYKIINAIEDAVKDVDSNIFPDLLLYNLVYKIKSCIQRRV